jgi:hypothetical protein
MKKLFVLLLSVVTIGATAQTITMPQPSPTQTITQDFALSKVEVSYSRPSAKGRTIFGDLVPFDKLWRTGANSPTTFMFGEDVTLNGTAVKAGTYSVITKPGKNSWMVMLSDPKVSSANYKVGDEMYTFMAKPVKLPMQVETFTIMLSNQTANSMEIDLIWADVEVPIKVESDIDTKVMAQIDKVMNGDNLPYFNAATYYYDNGKDMEKAMMWAEKAVEQQPTAYWVAHLKAKIQAKSGDKKGAMMTAKKSMELAEKAGNMDYVKLNKDLMGSM